MAGGGGQRAGSGGQNGKALTVSFVTFAAEFLTLTSFKLIKSKIILLRKGKRLKINVTFKNRCLWNFAGVFVKILGRSLPHHLFAVVPVLYIHSDHWDLCTNTLEVAPAGLKSCRYKKTDDDQHGIELDLAVTKCLFTLYT